MPDRATLGLARSWRSQGRGREAHDVVAELCKSFPDATDAPDVVQAHRFLATIA